LNALEESNRQGTANVQAMTQKGRALTPEEIVAVLNYLHALDQFYSNYVPTANALSALGRPGLSQRLAQVRQDIHQAIDIYNEMYRSTVEYRSRWDQMQRDTAAQVNQAIWQTTMRTQAVYDQMFRQQALINQGVPYSEALLLSKLG
jgi:hypothetical protein